MEQEIWKDVVGYEGLYQVSNLGRIRSLAKINKNKEKLIKQAIQNNGYVHVCLCKNKATKIKTVHRIVALAFIPNTLNKPEINHKDGNKQNNCVDNLEWVTRKENVNHAFANNLISKEKLRAIAIERCKNKKDPFGAPPPMKKVAKMKDNKIVKIYDCAEQAGKEEKVTRNAICWRIKHKVKIDNYTWELYN